MRIYTTIKVEVIKDNGDSTTLERTVVSTHGDNPSFERVEVVGALDVAEHQFKEANALAGTRPL